MSTVIYVPLNAIGMIRRSHHNSRTYRGHGAGSAGQFAWTFCLYYALYTQQFSPFKLVQLFVWLTQVPVICHVTIQLITITQGFI